MSPSYSSSPPPRQSLSQTQGLKQQQTLSPQQVLFVRLLGLNALEMEEEVGRQLDENPALEAIDDVAPQAYEGLEDRLPPSDDDAPNAFTESAEELQLNDFSHEDEVTFGGPDDLIDAFIASSGSFDPGERARDIASTDLSSTIMDHLNAQITELPLTPRQRLIASHITGNIDDNGYLTVSLRQIADEIAIHDAVEVTTEEVNEVFQHIRRLDPAGIGAVDLRDCLLLQLRRKAQTESSPTLSTAIEMIADYFDLFSKRHFDRLCSALSINRAQLKTTVDLIRTLNPKPGAIIGGSHTDDFNNQITPDFVIETDGSNIDLQMANTIPALRVESSFNIDDAALPQKRRRADDAMTFIRSRRDDALAYIQAINQRQRTLFRVMRAIISIQRDFFTGEGVPSELKPMILKDVSAITGDDISVVSRATAGKYVATRSGTYPLKFFFNEAPNSESADPSIKIIETLRDIIAAENPSDPYPDETLTAMLHERGYNIARRTVAKYREKALIPVARLRRRIE